jgi:hypothetical protein
MIRFRISKIEFNICDNRPAHRCEERIVEMKKIAGLLLLTLVTAALAGAIMLTGEREAIAKDKETAIADVDNPARQPFQTTCTAQIVAGRPSCTLTTVPAGKRLVIERVEARLHFQSPTDLKFFIFIETTAGGVASNHAIIPALSGVELDSYVIAREQVRLYADPGTDVSVFIDSALIPATPTCTYKISGYFVNLP